VKFHVCFKLISFLNLNFYFFFVFCHITDQAGEGGDSQRADKDSVRSGARKDADKKRTFRGISKAVSLAAKLSPKSQRKDKSVNNIAELKVCLYAFDFFCLCYTVLQLIGKL